MSDYMNDQAAGLRRLMAEPKPRIVSILSASGSMSALANEQPRLITNLAASIRCHGSDVLIVHAAQESEEATLTYELESLPALIDVANNKATLARAIRGSSHGCYVSRLLKNNIHTPLESKTSMQLNKLFNEIASQYEIVLVDAVLNRNDLLPLKVLNESEILIQLNLQPESIKQAYVLIKKICSQLGRRPFGIIVSDATDAEAEVVFRNISQVARRFMQIELEFFGAIPPDMHISRAERLGRAVIDAFPLALASAAFKELAQRVDYRYDYADDVQHASLC